MWIAHAKNGRGGVVLGGIICCCFPANAGKQTLGLTHSKWTLRAPNVTKSPPPKSASALKSQKKSTNSWFFLETSKVKACKWHQLSCSVQSRLGLFMWLRPGLQRSAEFRPLIIFARLFQSLTCSSSHWLNRSCLLCKCFFRTECCWGGRKPLKSIPVLPGTKSHHIPIKEKRTLLHQKSQGLAAENQFLLYTLLTF